MHGATLFMRCRVSLQMQLSRVKRPGIYVQRESQQYSRRQRADSDFFLVSK